MNRRRFLQTLAAGAAAAAVPSVAKAAPVFDVIGPAQMLGLKEFVTQRLDMAGAPWMVYFLYGDPAKGEQYDVAMGMYDTKPSDERVAQLRRAAQTAIYRAITR